MISSLAHEINIRLKKIRRKVDIGLSFHHIHGAKSIECEHSDFIVVCLVKNGEFFIEDFLTYYRNLGASRIVFVDNGSTDKTLDIAKRDSLVTIFSCHLPVKSFESDMRRLAATTFCRSQQWCLFVDMDEYFDYPGREVLSMKELLTYLNDSHYSSVIGQMMDMYPQKPLSGDIDDTKYFLKTHCYYETESVNHYDYYSKSNPLLYFLSENKLSDSNIQFLVGGVRERVFGTQNILTKHPLVRIQRGVIPSVHPHCSSRVVCADFSVLLRHYKFAGDFALRLQKEVASKTWEHGENEKYLQKFEDDFPILYKEGTSLKFTNTIDLLNTKFLYASANFSEFLRKKTVLKHIDS